MRYMMKAGILTIPEEETKLAQIKSTFWEVKKTIVLMDGGAQYQTDIDASAGSTEKSGDVRDKVYRLTDSSGSVLMEAHPGYSQEDDPDVVGWPVFRAPKADHAEVWIGSAVYLLVMHNNQNYSLRDETGAAVLQVIHRGIAGGWTMETAQEFAPAILCGLFMFCRYIEQENEFIVV